MPIRLGIVDDHMISREIVKKCCIEIGDFEVVIEAGTGADAVTGIIRTKPDAVLLDLGLPDFDGIEVVQRIRKSGARPRIVVLSAYCTPYSVYRLEQLGIEGFIHKPSQSTTILRGALTALRENRTFFSTIFLETQNDRRADPGAFDKLLTEEQLSILSLAAKHRSDREIAARLSIPQSDIETQLGLIMRKLNVRSRAELISIAEVLGFIMS
jgi:DNA-binding NarL/FixJ family response regulator